MAAVRIFRIPRAAREYMAAHMGEWTRREWADALGVAKPSIRAHALKLGLAPKRTTSGPGRRHLHEARVAELARRISAAVSEAPDLRPPTRRDATGLGRAIHRARSRQRSWVGDEVASRTACRLASAAWGPAA